MAIRQSPNEVKLAEMILYFANMSEADDSFGSIKLNKLLYHTDFDAYRRWGRSISGVTYFVLEHGPAPQPMRRVLTALQNRKALALKETEYFGVRQKKPVALRDAQTGKFTKEELELMQLFLRHFWGKSGRAMSEETHSFMGWHELRLKEPIPYAVAVVGSREPTHTEIAKGLELEDLALESLARNATRIVQRGHRGRSV